MATHTHEQHANNNFPVIGHGHNQYSRVNSTHSHSWSCTVTCIHTKQHPDCWYVYLYVPLVLVLDRWIYLLALGGHIGLMVDEVKGHGQEPAAVCFARRVLSVCIGGPLDVWGRAVHGSLGL